MKEILELLENNYKLTAEQIATMLNISVEVVDQKIQEYIEKKVIVKYQAVINWEKFEENETVSALIDVKITPQRDVGFDAIAERIYRFPEVKAVYLMSGAYDLSVLIEGRSMKEVAMFVATKLASVDNVLSTATHFVLKKYKQAGVILEDNEADRRLVITP